MKKWENQGSYGWNHQVKTNPIYSGADCNIFDSIQTPTCSHVRTPLRDRNFTAQHLFPYYLFWHSHSFISLLCQGRGTCASPVIYNIQILLLNFPLPQFSCHHCLVISMGKRASGFLSSLRQYHCCALICVTETKKVEQLQPLIAETTYARPSCSFTVALSARKIIKGPGFCFPKNMFPGLYTRAVCIFQTMKDGKELKTSMLLRRIMAIFGNRLLYHVHHQSASHKSFKGANPSLPVPVSRPLLGEDGWAQALYSTC